MLMSDTMEYIHQNTGLSNGMKLTDIKKAHFIGIGGIGMSALARLFLHEGIDVSGTNDNLSPATLDGVRALGGDVSLDSTSLPVADVYIFSEAWRNMNPELLEKASSSGIPTINYFDALGMVANEYYLIAVSGSHGKTTTTAMLIDIFEDAGLDPSAIVGSLRSKTKSNYRAGKSKYFIVEACEYRRDFMSLEPDILVITNLEHEHVDYYENLPAVQMAFKELAAKVPHDGFIIANLKDENVRPCLEGVEATVVDYSTFFNPFRKLNVPGIHNQMNAAAAVGAALQCGVTLIQAEDSLGHFAGTWRRFEYKGECNGAKVYDDYGHHPTEIKATLQGVKDLYPDKNIVLVFQSHTYTRTRVLFADFVSALLLAHTTVILPIYAAREVNDSGISHVELASAANAAGGSVLPMETFDEVVAYLRSTVTSDDVVIVMGAGDITRVATLLTAS